MFEILNQGIFLMIGVALLFICAMLYSMMVVSSESSVWQDDEFEDCSHCGATGNSKLEYTFPDERTKHFEPCKECQGKGFVRKERPK